MVPFTVRNTEQALFQNWVSSIPQSDGKTELLLFVGNTSQTVLTPPIGTGAGLVVVEIVPCIPIFAIVLSNCSPLSFTQIGTPFFPRNAAFSCIVQALLLFGLNISDGGCLF